MMNKMNLQLMKNDISEILEHIHETKRRLTNANSKMEEGVIVNGKSVGNGKISEYIAKLDSVSESLNRISSHCDQKIQIIEQDERLGLNQGHFPGFMKGDE